MRLEGAILPYLLNATRLASIYITQQSAVKERKQAPLTNKSVIQSTHLALTVL
jgi:hypothetical protein